ncbi:MAG: ATP-dependent nuclease [Anaerolineaceae bacterium]
MYLDKIKIEGYKCFRDPFDISFSKGLNVIVGENGVGKTAVIDAIRLLLLEDEFGRNPVSDTDFHRPFNIPAEQANAFKLSGRLSGLSAEEQVAFLPWTHQDGHASVTLLVDNKPNHLGRYKRMVWGGASRSSIFEWDLFDTINCIYLPPLRDAEAKLREGKASRLARLLKNLNKKSLKKARNANELHPLEKEVRDFNEKLAADKNQSIAKANILIRDRLVAALGTVFGQDTHIQFSETNFSRIVESLRLLFFPEAHTTATRDMFRGLDENSLGYNNLLYLATVLAELTSDSDDIEYLRLLLIEEPEAHLHPQLQIRLLTYLEKTAKKQNVQVIVTTHSPVLASAISLDTIVHLSPSGHDTFEATSLCKCGLTAVSESFVNRWLDVTKSTLLFAKGVILVEGIAEAMLVPELAKIVLKKYNSKPPGGKKALPISLEDAGVSVINMNGIYFRHFMQFFCNLLKTPNSNLPIRCAGITDNDPPKLIEIDGEKFPSMPTPSNPIKGSNHALKLIELVNKSECARLYANNLKTFEYDLAMEASNMNIMFSVAKSLLDTDGEIKSSMENYEKVDWGQEKDDDRKAEAAYYLLEHIDKGEFSQSLADYLSSETAAFIVPEYIQKAVIWACGGQPDAS